LAATSATVAVILRWHDWHIGIMKPMM
jgi:hypothetical protein